VIHKLINSNFLNMKKFLILFTITALLLSGCTSEPVEITDSGSVLPLDELSYDWGDISIDGGDVEHGFHFRNDSDEDLILNGAVTSCMCTAAYIELPDASISPTFGMHNNPDWSYTVKPGEEFEVEVTFDPMAHGPDAVGLIQRNVMLSSSAGEIEMDIATNVMYDADYQEKYSDINFVFEENEYDFGVVKQSSGINSYEFAFTYMGTDAINVTGTPTSCACTAAEISDSYFEKGDTGVLTVHFDPNLHEEPDGIFFKTVNILTDPELEKSPEVKIWAEMDLDLGPEAYTLQAHTD
jgi:hypothetical protein